MPGKESNEEQKHERGNDFTIPTSEPINYEVSENPVSSDGAMSIDSIRPKNAESKRRLDIARSYLTDASGQTLQLSEEDWRAVYRAVNATDGLVGASNMHLAKLDSESFDPIISNVRTNRLDLQKDIGVLGSQIEDYHAETIDQLNQLQMSMQVINNNINTLDANLNNIAQALSIYANKDALTNNIQLAEHHKTQTEQKLEKNFGHYDEVRRNAIGFLEATDLNAIPVETFINRASEIRLDTSRYWLASALLALAYWISATVGAESDDAMRSALRDSYKNDGQKTSLFFGLICLRANLVDESDRWIREYMSWQDPRKVDRTCIVLLNAYASGVMGDNTFVIDTMHDWVDELMMDPSGLYHAQMVKDWTKTMTELCKQSSRHSTNEYRALREFCPSAWPALKARLETSNLHVELRNYLERELNYQEIEEDRNTVIDRIISGLVTNFDAEELPYQRELEYQDLVIELQGDTEVADALRGAKDDALSETKSFTALLSDAARESRLSGASGLTHSLAIKLQLKQIEEAYHYMSEANRAAVPETIEILMGDFKATTTDGSNEDAVIDSFLQQVNGKEREKVKASLPPTWAKALLPGGVIVMAIGCLLAVFGSMLLGIAFIMFGAIGASQGYMQAKASKEAQHQAKEEMDKLRANGVIMLREIMREVRTWRNEFDASDGFAPGTEQYLKDQITSAWDTARPQE